MTRFAQTHLSGAVLHFSHIDNEEESYSRLSGSHRCIGKISAYQEHSKQYLSLFTIIVYFRADNNYVRV